MKQTLEKLVELEYNELVTLLVIESDDMLHSIFTDEVAMAFPMVKTLSINNKLSESTQRFIRSIFDSVILTKKDLIEKYSNYLSKPNDITKVEPIVEEDTTEPTIATKKLPKWYGKQQIEEDIKNNDGKATNAQLTALSINELKNIYSVLNKRIISEMLDAQVLSDEDYREIRATITLLKNKMKPIIKKSK